MDTTEFQFRTAAFGGFHKQDVLDYIERSAKEHGNKVLELQRQLEGAGQANAGLEAVKEELEAACAAYQEQVEALTAEQQTCSAGAAGNLREIERLNEQLKAERRRTAELESALAGAKGELERLRPAAEAYEHLKDRTAGIELEAHCRAQGVQADAEERVQRIQEQTEQWVRRVRAEYSRLRQGMDAAMAQISRSLETAGSITSEVSSVLERQEDALEGLAQACSADMSPKPPEPLPLEGR